jgi:hypothetical protein
MKAKVKVKESQMSNEFNKIKSKRKQKYNRV